MGIQLSHGHGKGHSSPHFRNLRAQALSCNPRPISIVATGWMDQDAGREVGLGPRDIVLDGDPVPKRKAAQQPPPLFGPSLLWPNGRPSQLVLSSCTFGYVCPCVECICKTCLNYSSTPQRISRRIPPVCNVSSCGPESANE